jgi:hypothetical protein
VVFYQEDEDAVKKLDKTSSRSKLPKAVQDLVCLIFDVESMKKAMMEFEVCSLNILGNTFITFMYLQVAYGGMLCTFTNTFISLFCVL